MEEFLSKNKVLHFIETCDITNNLLYRVISQYPSEDVARVVRCRECARWKPDGSYQKIEDGFVKMCGACEITHHYFPEDHFCSDGIYLANTQKSAAPEAPGAAGAESSD